MNKKVYQRPETLKVALEPQCIICTSPGGGGIPVWGEGDGVTGD